MSVLDRPFPLPSGRTLRGGRRAISLTFTLVLIVLAVLLPVMQNSDETAQGYRIRTLEQQKADTEAQLYTAQSDIAQLGSLARIDSEARGRLGMVPSGRDIAVAVTVASPGTGTLPVRYLPPEKPIVVTVKQSAWQKLLHLLRFPL
ncbi:MAG: hypothetical protein ACR2PL_26560 [Dehalococcoidia bacterium]